ncbi:mannosyl-oligosaccharide 1,2-alpha-mannosidase IA-like [Monodelphis domestica]|uniref:mannosyl-oligosaccharide 1,2-alpha-mannosidase IA-like n=1 Tax=Monodelphis domestica TaxID=13616 RepID=UPI00028BE5BB|nr:mannosyl-oligosaccharide 1,2-alpha-mannosidase IA-like isoform X2 [Monodelphis domestica]XP_056674663.1 mannosyl-oligosaccharide 1,2-alpha-mannosidase IA-like [Monodelphis domestica]
MRVVGHERIFRASPTSQPNRDTIIIGSRKVANQGSFKLTEKFVRLLLFSALITFCYGVISMPLSSKLFSRVLFHSNSAVLLTNDQKQRNSLGISSEEVGIENGAESEQKHLRAEKVKTIKMVMAAAAAAADVLVKIQQNHEQIWREAKEALKIMPEKIQIDIPKEVLQDKVHNNENSKELPNTDVGNAVKTVTQRPEFQQKGEKTDEEGVTNKN